MGREILRADAAALANCTPDTFSGYVTRGQAPAPKRRVGSTPVWDEDEIKAWVASRPGRGRWRPRTEPQPSDQGTPPAKK